jgi:hypothetical protein
MKRVKKSDVSNTEWQALTLISKDVDGGPWPPGSPYGSGIQPILPATVTEADLCSDDRKRTLGHTFHGPQGLGVIDLPAALCDRIDGNEGRDKARDASTLAHARNAIRKMTAVQLAEQTELQVPTKEQRA